MDSQTSNGIRGQTRRTCAIPACSYVCVREDVCYDRLSREKKTRRCEVRSENGRRREGEREPPASDDGGNSRDRAANGSWKKRKHIVHTRHAGHRSPSLSARLSLRLSFSSLYRRQVCPRFGWIQGCYMHTSQRATKEHAACTVDFGLVHGGSRKGGSAGGIRLQMYVQ